MPRDVASIELAIEANDAFVARHARAFFMIQLELIETFARLNAHDFRHFCITLDDLGADLVGADVSMIEQSLLEL